MKGRINVKQLCLIRHAKSSWYHPSSEDINRPLVTEGEEEAKNLGLKLKSYNFLPQLILTSNAVRAMETSKIIAKELIYDTENIIVDKTIYEAEVEDLLAVVQMIPERISKAILIGHNPAITWFANYLANDHLVNLPTCGFYIVEFATDDWQEIMTVPCKHIEIS